MQTQIKTLLKSANEIILGKDKQIRLALCCLFAKGHLLIEDLPGVGKTTLSHTLAKLLGLDYQRIQFTSDILPADILGTTVFEMKNQTFKFHAGAIFHQMILADEINRSTPKAQSALLEAMEERQVTIEGKTYRLPEPFFVIATQNPSHQLGTFPLPESQLDRFLMCLELGYPHHQAERLLLNGENRQRLIEELMPQISLEQLLTIQAAVQEIHVSEALLDYVQAILSYTRNCSAYNYGLSPRAGLSLLTAAKSWAFLHQRDLVIPEDVQAVLPAVAGHRLRTNHSKAHLVVAPILENVAIP